MHMGINLAACTNVVYSIVGTGRTELHAAAQHRFVVHPVKVQRDWAVSIPVGRPSRS